MDYQNVCNFFFSKEPREIYCEHEQLKVLLFDLCTHSIPLSEAKKKALQNFMLSIHLPENEIKKKKKSRNGS